MPKFKVKLKRYVEQTSTIILSVPEGEKPLENIPDLNDSNLVWENAVMAPLSHEVQPLEETEPNSEGN